MLMFVGVGYCWCGRSFYVVVAADMDDDDDGDDK